MDLEIYTEANKIWTRFAKDTKETDFQFSLEIHKKLLSFFQVGDYYYYIFNVKHSAFELVSEEIKNVLGYDHKEIDVPFLLSKIHIEDQPWFLKFENKVAEFFSTLSQKQIPNYKVRYDYRIGKKDGDYVRILQQVITIQSNGEEGVLRTFGVHTDITSIKKDGQPLLSFIGLNGEPSYLDVSTTKASTLKNTNLSRRELEILSLIIDGKKSEEISKLLFISKQTVDTHRRNLLKKSNCGNMASLISMAVRLGWV
jgi:DNA-binding CsgD family transcriptional regulator